MQESLRAALTNLSWIEVTGSAGDGLSALGLVRDQQPDLLVVDSNLLEDETLTLLRQVKQQWPVIRCLVLAQTTRQRAWALAVGADCVLSRNDPSQRLSEALGQIRLAP